MHRIYAAFGWAMIVLGVVHIFAATRYYEQVTQAALWFVSGGLAMILTGALNLLNRTYAHVAPGLRRVCVATNVTMTAFALATGLVGRASLSELIIVVGLFAGATALSVWPPAMAVRARQPGS
ncbi:MAG: hypothetical protein AB1635_14960 [Acidobacteriota bacterium]